MILIKFFFFYNTDHNRILITTENNAKLEKGCFSHCWYYWGSFVLLALGRHNKGYKQQQRICTHRKGRQHNLPYWHDHVHWNGGPPTTTTTRGCIILLLSISQTHAWFYSIYYLKLVSIIMFGLFINADEVFFDINPFHSKDILIYFKYGLFELIMWNDFSYT